MPRSRADWLGALLQITTTPVAAEEAARCYDRAAIKSRGPTAELNFPATDYADDPFLKASPALGRCSFTCCSLGLPPFLPACIKACIRVSQGIKRKPGFE